MTSQNFTYVGPAALASAFAQMLRETGVQVVWTPPEEQRGLADVPQEVMVNLLTVGSTAAVAAGGKAAMKKFRERFHGTADVRAEEPHDDGQQEETDDDEG